MTGHSGIPQDALDLYAWAVDLCSTKGYPLDKLHIRWATEDALFQFENGSWVGVVLPPKVWRNEGATLEFANTDEAKAFRMEGWEEDTAIFRLTPLHPWKIQQRIGPGPNHYSMKARVECRICQEVLTWDYRDIEEMYHHENPDGTIDPPKDEGHIPVCIRRHRPIVYEVQISGVHEYRIGCEMCRNDLVGPPEFAVWQRHKMQHDIDRMTAAPTPRTLLPFDFTRAYIRSLGKCPFDPTTVGGGRHG